MILLEVGAAAGPVITDLSPTGFFTNVAARLLSSELAPLKLNLNNIQIYPTNQYTPAVHRLLQVTANLYDSTTNRALGLMPEYPYCPSVFRPLFRRIDTGSNSLVVIAGYREVRDAGMANVATAPQMVDLDQPNPPLLSVPPYGMSFRPIDKDEPMVSGVPVIIGARKGFPNFNELAMQTQVYVSRLLEFRRAAGSTQGPVVQTNQMYVLGVTNTLDLEAWNSYLTNYPRELSLIASATLTAIMTNEVGNANVVFSNRVVRGTTFSIPAGSWQGWNYIADEPNSMILPFGTTNSFTLLGNSTALDQTPWVVPQTHIFSSVTQGAFYVPHCWLNLNTRLLFILVDTQASRIVDYVNVERWEPTVDITATLAMGNSATTNSADYKNPANQWLTNRLGNLSSPTAPTFGILNQIQIGLNGTPDWLSYTVDPASGLDAMSAVDGFRYNLMNLSPIYPKDAGKVFYKSNVFYAPFDPNRSIFIHTVWQVNDPFVHFLSADLVDLAFGESNRVNFLSYSPLLKNLGRINERYRPWGGNPMYADPATDYQAAVKDPGVFRSDYWDFPTNQSLGVDWVGRGHRGTPWQTIFLKSTNIVLQGANFSQALSSWAVWTGDDRFVSSEPAQPNPTFPDAGFTVPTNDWQLVSLLNVLFNTNSAQRLVSVNQAAAPSWQALLEGVEVLTNVSRTELVSETMSSNSPQATIISAAILRNRSTQSGQLLRSTGDILATPELSMASPWLDFSGINSITDEALEMIPSQLLPLLRPDSIGFAVPGPNFPALQFTGMDGYSYALQICSDLHDWTTVATNTPLNQTLDFVPPPSAGPARFYCSKLMP